MHTHIQTSRDKAVSAGLRRPYLRVVGIEVDSGGPGRASGAPLTPAEEEELRQLAARPDIYETVAKSIAPSIYGSLGRFVWVYVSGVCEWVAWVLWELRFCLLLFRCEEVNCLSLIRRLTETAARWSHSPWGHQRIVAR